MKGPRCEQAAEDEAAFRAYRAYHDEPGLPIRWDRSWRGASEEDRERWRRVAKAVRGVFADE